MRSTVALVLVALLMVAASPVAALAGPGLPSFAVVGPALHPRVVVGQPVVVGPAGHAPRGAFVATHPPVPAIRADVVSARPGRGHVWVPGQWAWRGAPRGHVWIGGYWTAPVRRHAAWVPGHWVWGRGGYVWVNGHWAGPW